MSGQPLKLEILPLIPDRWADLERLFGPRGACAGCWCMYWRLGRKLWESGKGQLNREAFQQLVLRDKPPGLLAYHGNEPVGWCSVGPREDYPTLERSRILARIDDLPVWSIVCLFVVRGSRQKGVSRQLVEGAIEFAGARGARVLEAYPIDPAKPRVADAFAWTGIASTFVRAGFQEVARRSPTRPIMRIEVPLREDL